MTPFRYKNIRGFDIAMNDAFGVGRIQRVGNLNAQIQNLLDGQRLAVHMPAQRFAFDELHRQEWTAVLFTDIVDGAYVGVIQRRSR